MAGFRSVTWFGLMAPENTPRPLVDRISRDVAAVFADPQFLARLKPLNVDPVAANPAEAAKFIAAETALWGQVVRDSHISPE